RGGYRSDVRCAGEEGPRGAGRDGHSVRDVAGRLPASCARDGDPEQGLHPAGEGGIEEERERERPAGGSRGHEAGKREQLDVSGAHPSAQHREREGSGAEERAEQRLAEEREAPAPQDASHRDQERGVGHGIEDPSIPQVGDHADGDGDRQARQREPCRNRSSIIGNREHGLVSRPQDPGTPYGIWWMSTPRAPPVNQRLESMSSAPSSAPGGVSAHRSFSAQTKYSSPSWI